MYYIRIDLIRFVVKLFTFLIHELMVAKTKTYYIILLFSVGDPKYYPSHITILTRSILKLTCNSIFINIICKSNQTGILLHQPKRTFYINYHGW